MDKQTARRREKVLTAVRVRTAPPGRHGDGGGLHLQVDESGACRWLLRIVVQGRRRDIGLGSASLVTLAEAREMAHDMRRVARAGSDPLADRRAARRVIPTFEEATRSCRRDPAQHTGSGKEPAPAAG